MKTNEKPIDSIVATLIAVFLLIVVTGIVEGVEVTDFDEKEFMRGMFDATEGVEHVSQGDSYDRGYSAQYELEQIESGGDYGIL